jgi:hypothetical protein
VELEFTAAMADKALSFPLDVERVVDDIVLFCMLVGNDFLPGQGCWSGAFCLTGSAPAVGPTAGVCWKFLVFSSQATCLADEFCGHVYLGWWLLLLLLLLPMRFLWPVTFGSMVGCGGGEPRQHTYL